MAKTKTLARNKKINDSAYSLANAFRDVIVDAVSPIRDDISGMRGDISGMRNDTSGMRGDISGMRNDTSGMRGDISGMRGDISGMRNDTRSIRNSISSVVELLNKQAKEDDETTEYIVKTNRDLFNQFNKRLDKCFCKK